MSEWKEYKINELAEVLSSKRIFYKDYVPEGIPFYRSKEIIEKQEGKEINDPLFIASDQFYAIKEKYGAPVEGDLLLSSVGMRSGIPYVVADEEEFYFKDGNLIWLRNFDSKLDSTFLYYWIKSRIGQSSLDGIKIGSAQPALTISGIKNLEIKLPEPTIQKNIVELLRCLDDKIGLLKQQNRILEQIGETIFRQWFLEEAQADWEFTTLEEYVSCYNGVSYKSAELNPSETAMVTLKNFARDGGFRLDGFKEFTGKYKKNHVVEPGDLVVAHTDITQDAALIGNPILVVGRREYKTLVISMDLVKVESNYEWLGKEFLYYLMRTRLFKQHCLGFSNGSTVLHLSKDAISSFEFFLPPKEKIQEFTNQTHSLLGKKIHNIKHIRNLESQRDTLLPKLMSGKIRVESDA